MEDERTNAPWKMGCKCGYVNEIAAGTAVFLCGKCSRIWVQKVIGDKHFGYREAKNVTTHIIGSFNTKE